MRINIVRINNAWVLGIELQENVMEYAYTDKKDLYKHVQRLVDSTEQHQDKEQSL